MIIDAFIYLWTGILWVLTAWQWQPWPDKAHEFFKKIGAYSYWLDPWWDMKSFWDAINKLVWFVLIFFSFKIISKLLKMRVTR